jgi:acetyltransferase-like isoleucine patch superfamily enzyme
MSAAITKVAGRQFFAHPQALVDTEEIGERTRVWAFAHVMAGAMVGSDCNLGEHAFVETGARIGNHVTVKNGVSVWAGITVEDNVFLGPHCVLTNDPNPRAYIRKTADELVPTLIRANATIGANATILCGVTIGRYAFIGAGTVVLRSVPDYGLMVGNPARQIGWVCVCASRLPFALKLQAGDRTCCNKCGRWLKVSIGQYDHTPKIEVSEE